MPISSQLFCEERNNEDDNGGHSFLLCRVVSCICLFDTETKIGMKKRNKKKSHIRFREEQKPHQGGQVWKGSKKDLGTVSKFQVVELQDLSQGRAGL